MGEQVEFDGFAHVNDTPSQQAWAFDQARHSMV